MTIQHLRRGTLLLVAATLLVLAGCRKVSGTYEATESGATVSLNFKSADKVDFSMRQGPMTVNTESTYTVDGDKVKVHPPQGKSDVDLVLTIKSDGSLMGDRGVKFVKK